MIRPPPPTSLRRAGAELALLIGIGLLMGYIGPYGTAAIPAAPRTAYWLIDIVGGGAIGIAIDGGLGRWVKGLWSRVALASLLMTVPVALLVLGAARLVVGGDGQPLNVMFLGQVLAISALVMSLRALAWRPPQRVVEVQTRTVVAPPLPEAEAAFRHRLSAKRRAARLIAVQAEDHYLRVHTDAGEELVTMRFADALAELAAAHGLQTHRSWWVAAPAIEHVQWRKGVGVARLTGGLLAPVSRTHAPALREAGWF